MYTLQLSHSISDPYIYQFSDVHIPIWTYHCEFD